MTEAEFLQNYDPRAFARPSITVDLVLMTVRDGRLAALLQQRIHYPFKGLLALPGGFVGIDEGLDAAAERVLFEKIGFPAGGWLEQLYTFGDPRRDPRMRVITIAYYALLPLEALKDRCDHKLFNLNIPWTGEQGGPVFVCDADGANLPLAFDHAEVLGVAVKRLRGKLNYSTIALSLLPEHFTLRDLQVVHEAILGMSLNKPAFRRRMLDRGWLEGTGQFEPGASYRPAELFRFKLSKGER